jgi:hypothetical protein
MAQNFKPFSRMDGDERNRAVFLYRLRQINYGPIYLSGYGGIISQLL